MLKIYMRGHDRNILSQRNYIVMDGPGTFQQNPQTELSVSWQTNEQDTPLKKRAF
jgi:hypothetical protein